MAKYVDREGKCSEDVKKGKEEISYTITAKNLDALKSLANMYQSRVLWNIIREIEKG